MKTKKVAIIKPTGEVEEQDAKVFFADKGWFAKVQGIVGGYVEPVRLGSTDLLVNEEGLLQGLPVNRTASMVAGRVIVGNAVLVPAGRI